MWILEVKDTAKVRTSCKDSNSKKKAITQYLTKICLPSTCMFHQSIYTWKRHGQRDSNELKHTLIYVAVCPMQLYNQEYTLQSMMQVRIQKKRISYVTEKVNHPWLIDLMHKLTI